MNAAFTLIILQMKQAFKKLWQDLSPTRPDNDAPWDARSSFFYSVFSATNTFNWQQQYQLHQPEEPGLDPDQAVALINPLTAFYIRIAILVVEHGTGHRYWHIEYETAGVRPVAGQSRYDILLCFDNYVYRRAVGPSPTFAILQWRCCSTCSRWLNGSTQRGMRHLASCLRCPECNKFLTTPNAEHACTAPPVIAPHNAGRSKYKKPRLEESPFAYDWWQRDDIIYMDTETYSNPASNNAMECYAVGWAFANTIRGGVVQTLQSPNCLDQFVSGLLTAHRSITVYAHNGSAFDFILVLNALQRVLGDRFQVESADIIKKGKRLMSLRVPLPHHAKQYIHFRDSYLVLPSSLRDAAKSFGVPQPWQKGDLDYKLVRDVQSANEFGEEVREYLINDVLSLGHTMNTYGTIMYEHHHIDMANCITLPQIAQLAWQSLTWNKGVQELVIPSSKDTERFKGVSRGGRTIPLAPIWESSDFVWGKRWNEIEDYALFYDYNSLYPSAMWSQVYPTGNYTVILGGGALALRHLDFQNPDLVESLAYNIFKVDVECPRDLLFAYLGGRDDKGNVTWDLDTKIEECYYGFELLHAQQLGYRIIRVSEELRWNAEPGYLKPLFKDFVERNMMLRHPHFPKGSAQDNTGKFLNNSGFGKLLLKPITHKTSFLPADADAATIENIERDGGSVEYLTDTRGDVIAYLASHPVKKPKQKQAWPIGAMILSYSKLLMSQVMLDFDGYRDARACPYYTDTDSLICPRYAAERIQRHRLGNNLMQLKNDLPDDAHIIKFCALAPKTYCVIFITRTDHKIWIKVRCKGIRHTGDKIEIKSAAQLNELDLEPELLQRARVLEEWKEAQLEPGRVQPYVSPSEALYIIEDMQGNKHTSRYLGWQCFKMMLNQQIQHITAWFGTFKTYYSSAASFGSSVVPKHMTRELVKEDWWQKGKRIYSEEHRPIWVPRGFVL